MARSLAVAITAWSAAVDTVSEYSASRSPITDRKAMEKTTKGKAPTVARMAIIRRRTLPPGMVSYA
ncbi:MAG TPA: hypothetical protein PLI66_05850, partial [Spirochaetales bacterium]|nr:hypothetical protein [Spirochaetales bacterium]